VTQLPVIRLKSQSGTYRIILGAESFAAAVSSKEDVISSQNQLISGKIRLYRERYQRQ